MKKEWHAEATWVERAEGYVPTMRKHDWDGTGKVAEKGVVQDEIKSCFEWTKKDKHGRLEEVEKRMYEFRLVRIAHDPNVFVRCTAAPEVESVFSLWRRWAQLTHEIGFLDVHYRKPPSGSWIDRQKELWKGVLLPWQPYGSDTESVSEPYKTAQEEVIGQDVAVKTGMVLFPPTPAAPRVEPDTMKDEDRERCALLPLFTKSFEELETLPMQEQLKHLNWFAVAVRMAPVVIIVVMLIFGWL